LLASIVDAARSLAGRDDVLPKQENQPARVGADKATLATRATDLRRIMQRLPRAIFGAQPEEATRVVHLSAERAGAAVVARVTVTGSLLTETVRRRTRRVLVRCVLADEKDGETRVAATRACIAGPGGRFAASASVRSEGAAKLTVEVLLQDRSMRCWTPCPHAEARLAPLSAQQQSPLPPHQLAPSSSASAR
jgi:hypothetical protein